MQNIFILVWWWYDKSGFGVVRAYNRRVDADRDFRLLTTHDNSKQYEIQEIELELHP